MIKPRNYLWIGALVVGVVGLAGCGGSSSSEEQSQEPMFPIYDDDGPVTMPDGTVVDRPNVEDIHPDAVPIEMEHEYANYVLDTGHLRDPRGNVYEVVFVNDEGVEERSYLAIPFWNLDTAYVLKGQGECYVKPAINVPNATLYGRKVIFNEQDSANGGAGAYRLRLDLLDTDWDVSWQLGEYGLIDRIVLLNSDDEIIASASRETDEYLEHHWVDRGENVSIRLPFAPINWAKVGHEWVSDEWYYPVPLVERACEPYMDNAFSEYFSLTEDIQYESVGEHGTAQFYFRWLPNDEAEMIEHWTYVPDNFVIQLFTVNNELFSEPCWENGEQAAVYVNSVRFDGPYAEWYELQGDGESYRRMQAGLTFDEDGYLVASSHELFTPVSKTELEWIGHCSDFQPEFD